MFNPTECTIGLDMGTTSVKAIAFDARGVEVARSSVTLTLFHDDPGMAEQDPSEVYSAVTQALGQTAADAQRRGYRVAAIGLSAAMHSLIAISDRGIPLTRAMTWMDTRAKAEADSLWNSPEGKTIYAQTGTPIHPMAPLPKLLWLKRTQPDTFARAARFVSLKEFVWHQLFDEWVVDTSLASATGLYNLREDAWDRDALDLVGISTDRLSTLVPTTYTKTTSHGSYLSQAGITEHSVFNVGASDGVLANLGVGAIGSDHMVITIGTSCAVRTGSGEPFTDPTTRSFCYVLGPGRFIIGGPSNSGGIVIDWLYHDVLRGRKTGGMLEAETQTEFLQMMSAAERADPGDLVCIPYVAGERAPIWNANAKAVCLGLTLQHTAADIMHAAVEGILLNAYWIAAGLFGARGRAQGIVASGKVLEPLWIRQMTADIFGIPLGFHGSSDASTVGAATLAQIATGELSWEDAARLHGAQTERNILPRDTAHYQERFARFKRVVEVLVNDLPEVYLGGAE